MSGCVFDYPDEQELIRLCASYETGYTSARHIKLMKNTINSLSLKTEFALVIGLAFGYFILSSIFQVFAPPGSAPITENYLLFLIIYEPIILLAVFWFLKQRGWQFDGFNLRPSLRTTAYGVLLAACAYISYVAVWMIVSFISPGLLKVMSQVTLVSNNISFNYILAVSVINPLFEELLVVGYVVTALKQVKGVTVAVVISVFIRLLYHLYQGPLAVMSIIPLGLIFGYWYAKRGNLWSVIVAHALFDFIGLYAYQ